MAAISDTKTAFAAKGTFTGPAGIHTGLSGTLPADGGAQRLSSLAPCICSAQLAHPVSESGGWHKRAFA